MWAALLNLFAARMDDLVYAELLLLSIMCSVFTRYIKDGFVRQIFSATVGILMVYYFTGIKMIYSLIAVVLAAFIQKFASYRYIALISFLVLFVYLGILRLVYRFGLPPLESHANAVQLILTLRLVGLSFEVQTLKLQKYCKRHDGNVDKVGNIHEPGLFDIIFYSYNFPGLFTGPYYTYAMYRDVIKNHQIVKVSVWSHIRWRVFNLLWTCPTFLLLVYLYPLNIMRKNEFHDEDIFYKIYFGVIVFFSMRCRMYSAWMVAESICILNGIGLYPENFDRGINADPTKDSSKLVGSTDAKVSSEAIRNVDIFKVEFESTFRYTVRAWNRSVQYWLATYVYKRVPRTFGVLLTMSVSAYWHGFHPGYYLAFLSFPLCVLAEDSLFALFPKDKMGNPTLILRLIWFIIKHLGLAYMGAGFLLLSYNDTIQYWRSMHFYFHWIMGSIILCCWLYKSIYLMDSSVNAKGSSKSPETKTVNGLEETTLCETDESGDKKRN